MTREDLITAIQNFVDTAPGNTISEEIALSPGCVGLKLFGTPIFGFGAPDDVLFESFQAPGVIGSHFLPPLAWMPGAKTVISFFLPYTETIKAANAACHPWPAEEWLHGRAEGQLLIGAIYGYIREFLNEAGYQCLVPTQDSRFQSGENTSNWSERHIAFATGLGTFGLSKGLITEAGICGRFGSVLTDLHLPQDTRPYENSHAYCNMCGGCIPRCPVSAISFAGKDSALCADFMDKSYEKFQPRYGCGKCQVGVACESGIPKVD